MSKYLLKISGSDDIVNIIEWDGIGVFSSPNNYILEPFVTESTDFINVQVEMSENEIETFSGYFDGYFSGELKESVTINGKSFHNLIEETNYGSLKFISGSDVLYMSSSNGFIVESGSILLALNNYDFEKQIHYSSSLSKLFNNQSEHTILKLKNKLDPTIVFEYKITNVELISSDDSNYYKLFTENVFGDNNTTIHNYGIHGYGENWYVDFDFGNKLHTGKFYGDFNGTINGKSIEDILDNQGINATKYPILKYENASNTNSTSLIVPNYLDTDEAPKRNYFRFDKERGNAFWNDPLLTQNQVEEVTLSLDSLDIDSQNILRNLVYDMLLGNWSGSSLTLRSIDYPNTYKTFRIFSAVVYQKQFINNQTPRYYELLMGDNWRIIDTSMMLDPDFRFKNEHQYSLPNDGRISYVKLFVQEVESGMDEFRFPQHDDAFSIFITKDKVKRKEVFEFTSTTTPWQVPSWADKLTIYSIGAGGGGGGGSVGWILNADEYIPAYSEKTLQGLRNDWFGFEFATGGGGGGGGNIAISEFDIVDTWTNLNNKTLPKNAKLNIFVGSGGAGGRGLTNDVDDFVYITPNEIADFRIKATSVTKVSDLPSSNVLFMYRLISNLDNSLVVLEADHSKNTENIIIKQFFSYLSYYYGLANTGEKSFRIQIGNRKTSGKDGSPSHVTLDSTSNTINSTEILLVKAQGGFGGMSGVSMQMDYNLYHRNCGAKYYHNLVTPKPLGGGASITDSFGNIDIIPGGHGGSGVSMPDVFQKDGSNSGLLVRNSAVADGIVQPPDGGIEANIATDIPIIKTSRKLKAPFGSIYKFNQGEIYEIDGYKKFDNRSNIINTKIAPLGGNGGLGVNRIGIENRPRSVILPDYYNLERWFKYDGWYGYNGVFYTEMPNNWYKWISEKVQSSIVYGDAYRPRILDDSTLISTNVTAVNNLPRSNYQFRLKDSGALGGLNIYTRTDGTPVELTSVAPSERVPTQPENGGHYGQGGGGGAAAYTTNWYQRNTPIQGQNGGGGGNGLVIIIAEEL